MAAAAINLLAPTVTPLLPTIANDIVTLITGLVHKAAPVAQATAAPNSGPVKFADVFASVMGDLAKASAAGQITGIPTDNLVKLVIQSVVTSMKIGGLLDTTTTTTATTSAGAIPGVQSIVLKSGQSLAISVA